MRYCPSLSHHLLAQLPFPRIVYTAQDRLLRLAHDSRRVSASVILPGGRPAYATERMIVQLYGSAEQPETLRLTEDERRRVWDDKSGLGDDLRSWARSDALLFLGYTANDPELSDFYYLLRPQDPMEMPRAYIVGPGVSADYVKYWEQRNVTLYSLDTATFLQKLGDQLNVPMSLPEEEPPALDTEERGRRDRLRARFEYLSHLNAYVETSAELSRRFEPHVLIQMRVELGSPVAGGEGEIRTETAVERAGLESLNKLKDGNIEWSQGNLDLARVYFEEALRRNPELTDAYLSLFHLLVEKGDLDDALQVYIEMLRQTPQQAFLPERYQIRNILGQSHLGVIYCFFDQEENRLVTATILRRAYAVKEENLAHFAIQMESLSSLRISRFLGFNRHRGRTYMLSEYIEGQSLRRSLREGQALPYADAMRIAGQIAEALEDGHRQGIPHLDLEPSNIMLTKEGVKLVSYGFSRLAPYSRDLGKPANIEAYDYLAPEQLAGQEGDERSDIYALGTILYEMLTGHTPGVGRFQHPSEVVLEVTEAVDVLIEHARERYPDKRFDSAREMRTEINRIALTSFGRWFGQYVRAGLVWVSHIYERLASRKTAVFFLSGLVALLVLSAIPSNPTVLRSAARLLLPLLLYSLMISTLFDWAVRAIARRKGLGSLITSGRGMGAILGMLFALNLIFLVGVQALLEAPAAMKFFAAMLAIVLFEAALALLIILGVARAAERLIKSYTIGFYWSFMIIVLIEIVLTVMRQPYGLFAL
jgi:tetratricopeptide (TPR) repeat protein